MAEHAHQIYVEAGALFIELSVQKTVAIRHQLCRPANSEFDAMRRARDSQAAPQN